MKGFKVDIVLNDNSYNILSKRKTVFRAYSKHTKEYRSLTSRDSQDYYRLSQKDNTEILYACHYSNRISSQEIINTK